MENFDGPWTSCGFLIACRYSHLAELAVNNYLNRLCHWPDQLSIKTRIFSSPCVRPINAHVIPGPIDETKKLPPTRRIQTLREFESSIEFGSAQELRFVVVDSRQIRLRVSFDWRCNAQECSALNKAILCQGTGIGVLLIARYANIRNVALHRLKRDLPIMWEYGDSNLNLAMTIFAPLIEKTSNRQMRGMRFLRRVPAARRP